MTSRSTTVLRLRSTAAVACTLLAALAGRADAATAEKMVIVSGNDQSAAAGTALPAELVIKVEDSKGKPVAGVVVDFAAKSGTLSARKATSNAKGEVAVKLTLGSTAGTEDVTVTSSGLKSLKLVETSTPGAAASLAIASGNAQTGNAGSALAAPLVVTATDAHGNAVPGATVTFTVARGGGSVGSATATTSASGEAQTTLTLGSTAGTNSVVAASGSLAPVTFYETGAATVTLRYYTTDIQPILAACTSCHSPSGSTYNGADLSTYTAVTTGVTKFGHSVTSYVAPGVATQSLLYLKLAGTTQGLQMPVNSSDQTVALSPSQIQIVSDWIDQGAPQSPPTSPSPTVASPAAPTVAPARSSKTVYFAPTVLDIINASCVSCHSPSGGTFNGADLSTYTAVVTGKTKFGHTVPSYVVPREPAQSLLYLKVAGTTQGSRMPLATGTPHYLGAAQVKAISDWIQDGAKNAATASSPAASIAIASGNDQSGDAKKALPQPLTVLVTDSTGNAVAGETVVFAIASGGGTLSAPSARTSSTGQASVSLTFDATTGPTTTTATAGSLAPVEFSETSTPAAYAGTWLANTGNPFDEAALEGLRAADVEPAPITSDLDFLRRVTADLAGRLPTESEMLGFAQDSSPGKRANAIDSLLGSQDFAQHWAADLFAAWTCCQPNSKLGAGASVAFNEALALEIADDKPISTLVTELITGEGPKATFKDKTGQVVSLTTGEIWHESGLLTMAHDTYAMDQLMLSFTGMTSECGRCHDHKLTVPGQDDPMWTQNDTYGLYAYLTDSPAGATEVDLSGDPVGPEMTCHFVGDGYAATTSSSVVVAGKRVPMSVENTPLKARQEAFAGILVDSNAFRRGTGHRIFADVMSPLLDPNQFLAANIDAVAQPKVLEAIGDQFQRCGFSLKKFLRLICTSNVYQLTTVTPPSGWYPNWDALLARRTVRRHHSEVIEHGIADLTDTPWKPVIGFEAQFGYPVGRTSLVDRTDAVNMGQPLVLMNSPFGTAGLATLSSSRIASLAGEVDSRTITLEQAIATIFHDALCRDPSAAELTAILSTESNQSASSRDTLEDVAVAISATSEFVSR